MSIKETSPKLNKRRTQEIAFTPEIEGKEVHTTRLVSEYFENRGTPDPTEINDVARTLRTVFGSEYPNAKRPRISSRKPISKK